MNKSKTYETAWHFSHFYPISSHVTAREKKNSTPLFPFHCLCIVREQCLGTTDLQPFLHNLSPLEKQTKKIDFHSWMRYEI